MSSSRFKTLISRSLPRGPDRPHSMTKSIFFADDVNVRQMGDTPNLFVTSLFAAGGRREAIEIAGRGHGGVGDRPDENRHGHIGGDNANAVGKRSLQQRDRVVESGEFHHKTDMRPDQQQHANRNQADDQAGQDGGDGAPLRPSCIVASRGSTRSAIWLSTSRHSA